MFGNQPISEITVPENSSLNVEDYIKFLKEAYSLLAGIPLYFASDEGINSLELAHMIPEIPETVIALYVGINDTVCNKGIVAPFLVRHAHNNVFVFDPHVYAGGEDVPEGTIDARNLLNGFEPPNESWNPYWTYLMIEDPSRTFESLWREKGYIDMIAAKYEDFTMLNDYKTSRICFFIDEAAFDHPVNARRDYLKAACRRGDAQADEFEIPSGLEGEVDELAPVILHKGEKLYVATTDSSPCEHAWSNIHPANKKYAVVNENSAVPLDLIIAKPQVKKEYNHELIPARGSADMTTDWFYREKQVVRKPLLGGKVKG